MQLVFDLDNRGFLMVTDLIFVAFGMLLGAAIIGVALHWVR